MITEPLTSKINTGQYEIRRIHTEITCNCENMFESLFLKKTIHMRSVHITNNKTGTVFFFIPGFILTQSKMAFLKWLSFMTPGQTGSPAVLCSTHPFPHWRMPAHSVVQTSGFSWFPSYPPWFNLLASVFCFVQCLLKILNYHHSYLQIVSHCARWTQKSLVPTRIYSQWWNKTTRITMGLCFNLTWRVPALFRPAAKWDPPRFKWRPGFSWAHESFENTVFCWLHFSSVKSNQSVNSELREEWT